MVSAPQLKLKVETWITLSAMLVLVIALPVHLFVNQRQSKVQATTPIAIPQDSAFERYAQSEADRIVQYAAVDPLLDPELTEKQKVSSLLARLQYETAVRQRAIEIARGENESISGN